MNHDSAYEQLEAFVFGTLDESEAAGVESHLATGCEACHARVREISELSVQLASAVPQHDPPAAIKRKLMASVAAAPRAAERSVPAVPRSMPAREAKRRSGWSMWIPSLVTAAAAVIILMWTFGLKTEVSSLRVALDDSRQELDRMREEMGASNEAARLLGLPCTRLVDLAGVDPNPQAAGRVVLHPDEPVGVLYVYHMPEAPEGRQYQLWTLRDGVPVGVGLFTVAEDGSAVLRMAPGPDPTSINEFKVTIEPMGGRQTPQGMLYLTGANTLVPMH